MKSNLSEPGVRKVIKKKVVWADDRSQPLVQTSFFEVEDSELSEMHIFARTCAANISIAQLEKVMERDFRKRRGVQDINGVDTDEKQLSTPLPALIRILVPETIQTPPIISEERAVQEKREETVLQALFIPPFLPDSPGEPDGDLLPPSNSERSEPKLIPLEDVRIRRKHPLSQRDQERASGVERASLLFPTNKSRADSPPNPLSVCICVGYGCVHFEQSDVSQQPVALDHHRTHSSRSTSVHDEHQCNSSDADSESPVLFLCQSLAGSGTHPCSSERQLKLGDGQSSSSTERLDQSVQRTDSGDIHGCSSSLHADRHQS